jgi:MoxR-like ATPase
MSIAWGLPPPAIELRRRRASLVQSTGRTPYPVQNRVETPISEEKVALVASLHRRVSDNIARAIVGKQDAVELLLVCLLCEGHALIEDVPGVGKTTLARAVAKSFSGEFRRIQFTPDLLPSDISGISFFDQRLGDFRFRPGPVFANIVLADEINRATPRTQSALLEAMEERTVTVEGDTMELPRPFLVLATENPIELEGTFPLPEAQLDRFLFRISLGYPDHAEEDEIVSRHRDGTPLDQVDVVASGPELIEAMGVCRRVYLGEELTHYVTSIVRATRHHPAVSLGGSPRASLALSRTAQALAAIRGRSFVTPDDVKVVVHAVLAHRVLLSPDASLRGRDIGAVLSEVLASIPVPVEGRIGLAADVALG